MYSSSLRLNQICFAPQPRPVDSTETVTSHASHQPSWRSRFEPCYGHRPRLTPRVSFTQHTVGRLGQPRRAALRATPSDAVRRFFRSARGTNQLCISTIPTWRTRGLDSVCKHRRDCTSQRHACTVLSNDFVACGQLTSSNRQRLERRLIFKKLSLTITLRRCWRRTSTHHPSRIRRLTLIERQGASPVSSYKPANRSRDHDVEFAVSCVLSTSFLPVVRRIMQRSCKYPSFCVRMQLLKYSSLNALGIRSEGTTC